MKSQILISVIIPVYNKANRIKKAVNSALNNKSKEFEIVIIDDGSTDNSGEIVDEMAAKDKRIRVFHQENQWVYAAFNRGIKEAKGEYIYILNADDELFEGSIDLLENIVKTYSFPDVVWTRSMQFVGGDVDDMWNSELMDTGEVSDYYYCDKGEVEKSWKFLFINRFVENQANLYKRTLALKHPFRNDVYAADGLFNIQIADEICSAFVMSKHVYKYYRYAQIDQNISKGKFYPYQHSMNNELYEGHKRLFEKWGIDIEDGMRAISRWRLNSLSGEFNAVCSSTCDYSIEKKIETIIDEHIDDTVYECVERLDGNKELDSRIMFALRNLFSMHVIEEEHKYYFLYKMVQSFHKFEKNKDDMNYIEQAIMNSKNVNHIGQYLMKELE